MWFSGSWYHIVFYVADVLEIPASTFLRNVGNDQPVSVEILYQNSDICKVGEPVVFCWVPVHTGYAKQVPTQVGRLPPMGSWRQNVLSAVAFVLIFIVRFYFIRKRNRPLHRTTDCGQWSHPSRFGSRSNFFRKEFAYVLSDWPHTPDAWSFVRGELYLSVYTVVYHSTFYMYF
jgi:hypothetical protein